MPNGFEDMTDDRAREIYLDLLRGHVMVQSAETAETLVGVERNVKIWRTVRWVVMQAIEQLERDYPEVVDALSREDDDE